MYKLFSIEIISIILAILSLVFGLWQYRQNRNNKKLIAMEAVSLHKNIAIALGATQAAQTAISDGKSPNFEIGRAEGLCQAVLFESAKLFCNLKNTKIDDIDDLIFNKQLASNYQPIYYSFSDKKRGFICVLMKKIKKLI